MSVGISAVVLTKNEESNIVRCVQSLSWADEIVVVDDGSTDQTVQRAEANGARVITHPFESFALQRNWALQEGNLAGQWVLMLDADEVSTDEFASEIKSSIQSAPDTVAAFRTCRKTMLADTWLKYSDSFPVWIMRLVRRERAWFQDSGHGEVPVPDVDGSMGTIKSPFIHYPFSRGLSDWWQRHIRYAEREAIRELSQQHDTSTLDLLTLDRSKRRRALRGLSRSVPARGTMRFLYQFVLKRGFLDGRAGLQFCRMMGAYESMIAIKKWELGKTEKPT